MDTCRDEDIPGDADTPVELVVNGDHGRARWSTVMWAKGMRFTETTKLKRRVYSSAVVIMQV